ncbi:hypothetical protein F8271_31020, partial [Micromonospora sp. ALFpr18c]
MPGQSAGFHRRGAVCAHLADPFPSGRILRRSFPVFFGQNTRSGGRRRAGLPVRQNRRVPVHQITDPDDDRIADYRAL